MKNLKKIIIGIGLVLNQSYADDVILKEPGYGGNGCPSGSASTFYSKDKRSLSLVLDDIDVEAGPMVKKIVARKSCNIAIPVDASQGYQFRLKSISSLKGLLNLPEKALARFSSEVFFAGERGPRYRKSFKGPLEKDYKIKFANHHPWSRCGRDKNLRLNFSLLLKNSNLEKPAKAILSTEGGLTFNFEVRNCGLKVKTFLDYCLDSELEGEKAHTVNILKEVAGSNNCRTANDGLQNRERLLLTNKGISDLSPLVGLKLKSLSLRKNNIQDLGPLKHMVGLQSLILSENKIEDIGPLKSLVFLKRLSLPNNKIKDISSLKYLKRLERLYLKKNSIEDFSALEELPHLEFVSQ